MGYELANGHSRIVARMPGTTGMESDGITSKESEIMEEE